MANELNLGYRSGATLTYGAYQPDGTVRTAAGTSLPEIGSTGYYTTTDANLVALDIVVVKEGTDVAAYGQYRPEVTAPDIKADIAAVQADVTTVLADLTEIDGKVDIIDNNVDALVLGQSKVVVGGGKTSKSASAGASIITGLEED